jgi:hypothetical protein
MTRPDFFLINCELCSSWMTSIHSYSHSSAQRKSWIFLVRMQVFFLSAQRHRGTSNHSYWFSDTHLQIVPSEHLLVRAVSKGPMGTNLQLKFTSKDDPKMVWSWIPFPISLFLHIFSQSHPETVWFLFFLQISSRTIWVNSLPTFATSSKMELFVFSPPMLP